MNDWRLFRFPFFLFVFFSSSWYNSLATSFPSVSSISYFPDGESPFSIGEENIWGKKNSLLPGGSILNLGRGGSAENAVMTILASLYEQMTKQETETVEEKLEEIWRLSSFSLSPEGTESETGIKQSEEDRENQCYKNVCLTNECLDASLSLLKAINFSVNPCDDFYEYACGRWKAENPIPPIYSRWGSFSVLRDKVNNVSIDILSSPANSSEMKPVEQSKEYFQQCSNLTALNSRGAKPLIDIVNEYGGWPAMLRENEWNATGFNIVHVLADLSRRFSDSFILSAAVYLDWMNTTRRVIFLDQPDFFLDRSILLHPEDYKERIQAYEDYFVGVAKVLARENGNGNGTIPTEESLRKQAKEVIAFETKLAGYSSANENRTQTDRMYNPRKLNEYQAETKFPWKYYLDTLFSSSGVEIRPDEDLVVNELEYLKKAVDLIQKEDKRVVANYIQWRLVAGLVEETTDELRELRFKFRLVNGGPKVSPPRVKTCASNGLNSFGMAIGVKYIEAVFDIKAKQNVELMVHNLRTSFLKLIDATDWMDGQTKCNARLKAKAMHSFMAFPDWLFNKTKVEGEYAGYELCTQWLESAIRFSTWNGDYSRKKLRQVVDKDEWPLDNYPPIVNAFYSPDRNSITFPAGILAPPFYRSNGPEFLNYGGIGAVIGHEITHGFDDQGRQYDLNGNAINWWTNETLARFVNKTKCFINQYSKYGVNVTVVEDGKRINKTIYVNGELTQGENIADNGGVRQSFQAYQTWKKENNGGKEEKRLPGLEKLSPDQLFYVGFANVWCENINDGSLVNQILGDPHSPGRYRTLGVMQNSEVFSKTWNCPCGSGMNPSPTKQPKCLLW